MSKFKVGDEIELRVRVVEESDADDCTTVVVGGDRTRNIMTDAQLSAGHLIPRPIKVGDRVRVAKNGVGTATVKAIDGSVAWCKFDDASGVYCTHHVSVLEPVK